VISLSTEMSTTLLSVLADEANRGDRQVREALFLTFNADLGFFESHILGSARATGAAVTVVADARVYEPDPRAVRAAGVRYAVGLVATQAVFHPKLVVLAGHARATVAIGSGNLTLGGWHLNDEVLTVVSGDNEAGCPPIFGQLAAWLNELPDAVRMGARAAQGIRSTAAVLSDLCSKAPSSESHLALASNLTEPLVEQLPNDPIDELRMFAPFHDLTGRGFEGLLRRVRPRRVRVALQERITVVNPSALMQVADKLGVSLTFEGSEGTAYRHGKIIEGVHSGKVVWSLSGSANLSSQALNKSVRSGGNCELAVLDRSAQELYPDTSHRLSDSELVIVRTGPPASEEAPPERPMPDGLLEACLDSGEIKLTFAQPLLTALVAEVSEYASDPDHFERLSELAPGTDQFTLPADPDWTFPVRLRLTRNHLRGSVHFITRLDTVRNRATGSGGSRAPSLDPEQIFADVGQADNWLRAVNQLAADSQMATRGLSPRAGSTGTQPASSGFSGAIWDDPATWHAYVEDASTRLGDALISFTLGGLPRFGSGPAFGRAVWEDDFTPPKDELDDEDGGRDGGQTPDKDPGIAKTQRDRAPAERARYRRWLNTLLEGAETHQAIDRAGRGALVMIGTRMKIWEQDQEAPWFDLLAKATKALAGDDIPPQQLDITCAEAQVMLYLLADGVAAIGSRAAARTYKEVEASVRGLLQPVDPKLIAHFTDSLRVSGVLTPEPEFVASNAADSLNSDAVAQALNVLKMQHADLTLSRSGDATLYVTTENANPLIAGALCLEELPGQWGVFSVGRTGRRAFLTKTDEYLLTAESSGNHVRFRTYRLGPLTSPTRAANGGVQATEKPRQDAVVGMGALMLQRLGIDQLEIHAYVCGSRPSREVGSATRVRSKRTS
jgi:hypothetical protein